MPNENAILIEPNPEMAREFLEMAEEFQVSGDNRYQAALENLSVYLENLSDYAAGRNLKPNRVPGNEFWLFADNRIVGRSKLRHYLTPALEIEGGHIGYDVRPSERMKGYGTLILKLTLDEAKERGIKQVLITCDTDNIGSAKIIENNGGVLAKHAVSENSGKQISLYWIEI